MKTYTIIINGMLWSAGLVALLPAAQADEDISRQGLAVYQSTCIACHGANGKGALPGAPDFTKAGGTLAQSDETLLNHIMEGFQSPGSPMAMPAKGGNPSLSEAQARAVIYYLRKAFTGTE